MLTLAQLQKWLDTYVIPKLLPESMPHYMQWNHVHLTGQDEFPYNASYEDEPEMLLTVRELVALFPTSPNVLRYIRGREEGRHRFCLCDHASVRVVGPDTFVFSRGRYVLRHNVFSNFGSLEIMRFQTRETRWCYDLLRTLVWEHPMHWESVSDAFLTLFQYVDAHPSVFSINRVSIMTQCQAGFEGDWDALFRIYDESIRPARSRRCRRWLQRIIVQRYRADKGMDLRWTLPIRVWYLGCHQVVWVWPVQNQEEDLILLGRCDTISTKIALFWARVF